MSNLQSIFPACHVVFPASADSRRATFYLAAEEYIAQKLPADNYLFSWQLSPTVVIGRNQVVHQEINLDFCQAEGIDVVRRKVVEVLYLQISTTLCGVWLPQLVL